MFIRDIRVSRTRLNASRTLIVLLRCTLFLRTYPYDKSFLVMLGKLYAICTVCSYFTKEIHHSKSFIFLPSVPLLRTVSNSHNFLLNLDTNFKILRLASTVSVRWEGFFLLIFSKNQAFDVLVNYLLFGNLKFEQIVIAQHDERKPNCKKILHRFGI